MRVVEPFSAIEIEHIAKLVKLPMGVVEDKLCQMILDGGLKGVLGNGILEVFEERNDDSYWQDYQETIKNLGTVVEKLSAKAALLN